MATRRFPYSITPQVRREAVSYSATGLPRATQPTAVPKTEKANMNNKFDELTKSMAQSVTRRAALKKFGVGLAGMALAGLLARPAEAQVALGPPIELSFPNPLVGCDN